MDYIQLHKTNANETYLYMDHKVKLMVVKKKVYIHVTPDLDMLY